MLVGQDVDMFDQHHVVIILRRMCVRITLVAVVRFVAVLLLLTATVDKQLLIPGLLQIWSIPEHQTLNFRA